VDPRSDIETISTELGLADLATVEKALQRAEKAAKAGGREALERKAVLERVQAHLDTGAPLRTLLLTDPEREALRDLFLLTGKPVLYIANVAEDGFNANNPLLDQVQEIAGQEDAWRRAGLRGHRSGTGRTGRCRPGRVSGRLRPVRAGAGSGDPRRLQAVGVGHLFHRRPQGSAGLDGAGRFHRAPGGGSDSHRFRAGFIRAEVIAYADYIAYNGEAGAREAGKWRLEGKEYIVQEGDVMHFRFNV
jgi:ribosome-binding ATPase YchF (GTP1/OBG family)